MKVVVTGGAGFIGSHLVDRLMEEEYEVIVVDNLSAGSIENIKRWFNNERFKFLKLDLKNLENLYCSLKNEGDIDAIFHFAANPEVRIGISKPNVLFNENVLATFNVLEVARKIGIKYFIFASSSTVYGDAKVIPTPEDYSPLKPISVYGATKLACEALVSAYAHTYDIRGLSLRLANIIGSRSKHGVIYDFILKLLKNPNELEILGDGTQRKSYLHISDCIDAIMLLFKEFQKTNVKYDVFNIGNEDWITVKEIADIVTSVMGLKNTRYIFTGGVNGGRGWKGDVKFMLLSIEKIKRLGWRPRLNCKEAVKQAASELYNEIIKSKAPLDKGF